MPTSHVHRLELMRLLHRFKGLVEWELAKLAALDGETISLELERPAVRKGLRLEEGPPPDAPPPLGPTRGPSAVPAPPPIPGAGAPDGSLEDLSRPAGAPSYPLQKTRTPTNLESCCRSADLPTGDYTELVDAATPYVRALAEE